MSRPRPRPAADALENPPHRPRKPLAPRFVITVLWAALITSGIAYRWGSSGAASPLDRLQSADGWADETSCVQCHEQGQTFWQTGHAQTLQRSSSELSRSLLAAFNASPDSLAEGTQVATSDAGTWATNQHDGFLSRTQLDWCFGSGRHARTWVATLSDSRGATDLLEFRWTWYHSIEGFNVTPGQPDQPTAGYFGRLGVLFDQPKARRCFGCHASYVPLRDGEIQGHGIRTGVTCQRCHGPRAEHVATEGAVHNAFWEQASQEESVARCAECHRRADEVEPGEIRADNREIVRFQPIGLVQSACFRKSTLTCVTCHDPHRTLEAQDSTGIWQCLQCHDAAHEDRPGCRAGHTTDCLRCHMPKIKMDRPLEFTDHWIRVRDDTPTP
uniref:Cytochrome c-552/4 domain-containing protein n=1 Tax=Schlesneria paludicola TaxID=360056 RepID=A0A7C2JZA6_9PLAN